MLEQWRRMLISDCMWRARSNRVFFFQAEDGIRDGRVTGVQTCALPISPASSAARSEARIDGARRGRLASPGAYLHFLTSWRSEERRVGKECRSRGLP